MTRTQSSFLKLVLVFHPMLAQYKDEIYHCIYYRLNPEERGRDVRERHRMHQREQLYEQPRKQPREQPHEQPHEQPREQPRRQPREQPREQ